MQPEVLPALVALDELLHVARVEQPAALCGARKEQVAEEPGELPAEPETERHAEPLLPSIDHRIRQPPAHGLLEDGLP